MDVTFFQQWTVRESIYGDQVLTFVVSSNYDNLFLPWENITGNKYRVNCFNLQSGKKDLNIEKNAFAVDELTFSINQASCGRFELQSNELKSLYFCLEASDINNIRFVSMHFGQPSLDNSVFTGMINNKISGSENFRLGSNFNTENPNRNYSFSALSFDVSLLEKAIFNGTIEAVDGSIVQNLEDRLKANSWQALKDLPIKTQLSYITKHLITAANNSPNAGWVYTDNHKFVYAHNQVNLWKVVQLILNEASNCIKDIFGVNGFQFHFNLQETNLGIKTMPVTYELIDEDIISGARDYKWNIFGELKKQSPDDETVLTLYLKNETNPGAPEADNTMSAIYVHESFISPEISNNINSECIQDKSNSLVGKSNAANMLYEIAESLGCYVFFHLESGLNIKIEIVPQGSVVSDEIFIIGVKSGDLNTSNMITKEATNYMAVSSHKTGDMIPAAPAKNLPAIPDSLDIVQESIKNFDTQSGIYISDSYKQSSLHALITANKELLKKSKNKESKQLLLTTAPIYRRVFAFKVGQSLHVTPLNSVESVAVFPYYIEYCDQITDSSHYRYPAYLPGDFANENQEIKKQGGIWFTNAINVGYLSNPNKEPYINEAIADQGLSTQKLIRPAWGILVKIGDEDKYFDSLTDYINFLHNREIQYYETEYNITIPFWNAFSKSSDGSNASIKNLKLGSRISLKETLMNYNSGTDSWETNDINRVFIVVGIEYNFNLPEVKLKLHSLERFSFTDHNGIAPSINTPVLNETNENYKISYDQESIVNKFIATNEVIFSGDAVKIYGDKLFKARANKDQPGSLLGIALQGGVEGNNIFVLTKGEVFCDELANDEILYVFVRDPATHPFNYSDIPLSEPTADENQILILGKKTSRTSFELDIKEYNF